jgi:UDP-N-acetylglucosamine 1-carboxyvinyltransferase
MDKLVVTGGKPLAGTVAVSGAKNSALPLLSATLLAPGVHRLENVPKLRDIETFKKLLRNMGCKTPATSDPETAEIDATELTSIEAPYEMVKTMRASVLVLGPLVARMGRAKVSLPGGCAIGARPIDIHLKGLEAMGAQIKLEHGFVFASVDKRLTGAEIQLDFPSVTGTENLMMAAALAEGRTVLHNAAKEPEIVDLANALRGMGAKLSGDGTDTITIDGVTSLTPMTYRVMHDRIEMGTFLCAGAIAGGDITVTGGDLSHLEAIAIKLRAAGVTLKSEANGAVRVKSDPARLMSVDVKTLPYPGFATDMQAQFMAVMCLAKGASVISETVFENRFQHVPELHRMGVDIRIEGSSAIVHGGKPMSGAHVMATDLRASASLVLAGLAAEGETHVHRVYHLDRGYDRIEEKLGKLGANIRREKDDIL